MKKVANDISFGSLHGVAIHQEMVVRYLHRHGSGSEWLRAYEEAKIVRDSLDRMVKDHPNYRFFAKEERIADFHRRANENDHKRSS